MHRRLLKSLATVMGAAALIVAPMALSAQADTLTVPDKVVPFSSAANDADFWVQWLEDERDIEGAYCEKVDDVDAKTWTIPAQPGKEYVAVITKAGSGDEANWVFYDPMAGDVVTGQDGKDISHVIWCTVDAKTTTPPMTTPPASTPPVVDTDRVDTAAGSGLGLYGAAAALLVGAGAIVLGRRRQGAHR